MKFGFSTVNFVVFKLLKQFEKQTNNHLPHYKNIVCKYKFSNKSFIKKVCLFMILGPIFVGFATLYFKWYETFLWICSLFYKSQITFSSKRMKLHNQYYHRVLQPQFWWWIPYLKEKERKIKLLSWLQIFFNSCWYVCNRYLSRFFDLSTSNHVCIYWK